MFETVANGVVGGVTADDPGIAAATNSLVSPLGTPHGGHRLRGGSPTQEDLPRPRSDQRWFTVIGILAPVAMAPELDKAALVGIPAAQRFLGADMYPTTIYVRTDRTTCGARHEERAIPHRRLIRPCPGVLFLAALRRRSSRRASGAQARSISPLSSA